MTGAFLPMREVSALENRFKALDSNPSHEGVFPKWIESRNWGSFAEKESSSVILR
jgi:hypothetical protein